VVRQLIDRPGSHLLDFGGSRTAKAVGAKHNKPTTASHHFRFLLFITTTPFEQRSPSEPGPRGSTTWRRFCPKHLDS